MTIFQMIALHMAKVPVMKVRHCLQRLTEAGLTVRSHDLAAHHLAGGRIEALTDALVTAKSLAVSANFHQICAIDLAIGSSNKEFPSPTQVVFASKTPRAVRLPEKGVFEFAAPAKFTWRPWGEASVVINLDRFIGGAFLDTIESRLQATLGGIYDQAPDAKNARAAAAKIDLAFLDDGSRFRLTELKVRD